MKKYLKIVLGFIVTSTLLYFLLFDIPFNMFTVLIKKLSLSVLLVSFLVYLVMNLFRVIRLKRIFPEIRFLTLLNIVFIHNMVNNILPFRLGEFSYLYMIKKEKSSSHAISSLFMLRICDALAVFLLFALFLLFIEGNVVLLKIFGYASLVIVLVVVSLLLFTHTDLVKWKKIIEIRDLLRRYNFLSILILIIDSLFIWFFSFLFYYIIVRDLGISLSFFQVSIAAILIIFSTVLPISGIAGFGTTELAWTMGLVIFGLSKDVAILSGLLIHLIRLVCFMILGGFGFILRRYIPRIRKEDF